MLSKLFSRLNFPKKLKSREELSDKEKMVLTGDDLYGIFLKLFCEGLIVLIISLIFF